MLRNDVRVKALTIMKDFLNASGTANVTAIPFDQEDRIVRLKLYIDRERSSRTAPN
jgi:hypothetical protein